MSKHTPGPWTVSTNATGYGRVSDCRYQIDSEELCVAIIVTDVPELENEANARLIAAAPELLAACKAIEFSERMGELLPNAIEMVRNAIAKAEER